VADSSFLNQRLNGFMLPSPCLAKSAGCFALNVSRQRPAREAAASCIFPRDAEPLKTASDRSVITIEAQAADDRQLDSDFQAKFM
jgi:hypothetical protein